jgi:hypothetical protein
MTRPRFRIYYDDGSVWDSRRDGPWNDAPSDGVQVVMIKRGPRKDYQEIVQGHDLFILPALGDDVKVGRQMDDDAYQALVERAIAEGW